MVEAVVERETKSRSLKSLVLKILTSKFFDIKILTHPSCETSTGQGFQKYGGEGVPLANAGIPDSGILIQILFLVRNPQLE